MLIKAKSKTGQIVDIQVEEILEIDGKPFVSQEQNENIVQLVNHLSGRLAALENIFSQLIQPN